MRFSLDWLRQYVDLPSDVDEICHRLTDAGFNVEGREVIAGDEILDLEVTTNRSDCMNHLGLARELGVMFETTVRPPGIGDSEGPPLEAVPVAIDDFADCPRFTARLVRGVEVGPSPDWLVHRLESIGQRPINNVVDVTNFVLWETGQPLHGYDLDKLDGPAIRVRRAAAGERLRTLDGEERELDPEVLVIADDRSPIGVAGVMGGLDSEVTTETSDVLIEAAHFEPHRVRRAARRLGLPTDASHRFERGTDPEAPLRAATRAAELIAEMAGGEIDPGIGDQRDDSIDWRLHGGIDAASLSRFAGLEISDQDIERVLAGLGYEPEQAADGEWRVRVPSWRYYDCEAWASEDPPSVFPADIYEEVMRHIGFGAIPAALPALGAPDEGSSAPHRLRNVLRFRLAACGLSEAINYAFYDGVADAAFPTVLIDGAAVELQNPLSENYGLMRRSLVPGLVESARFNQRRGAEAVRLYEIGHIFTADAEIETVALVCGGTGGVPWDHLRDWELFAVKGVVDELARGAVRSFRYESTSLDCLIDGTSAVLVDAGSGDTVGYFGQLDCDGLTFPLFVAEILTDALIRRGEVAAVRTPSRFPGISADATLTHSLDVTWQEIRDAIAAADVPDLVDYGLKDRYAGKGVPDEAVNTTIFFRYNAADRSLTQDEVNDRHLGLIRALEDRFCWS